MQTDESITADPLAQPIPELAQARIEAMPERTRGLIVGILGEHIEPVTRFDASHLREIEPERLFSVPMTLVVQQDVVFSSVRHEGAGRLSASVEKVAGETALATALAAMVASGTAKAQTAIQRWSANDQGRYRRLLPAAVCSPPDARLVGYEHRCGPCAGIGRVTCGNCNGKGRNSCNGCHGQGKLNCYSCHGSKRLSCSGCYGSGSISRTVYHSVWDSQSNSQVNVSRIENQTCHSCSGAGHTTCHTCDWGGKINCAGCGGSGEVNCIPCGTTGKVNCAHCQATGIRYVQGRLQIEVALKESLAIDTDDEELATLVRRHIDPAALPSFGGLAGVSHDIGWRGITSTHALRLDAALAVIGAGSDRFRLHAFGDGHAIFDFRNIAGHLLSADLTTLQARIATARWWRPRSGAALLDDTAHFVASELNLLIAEQVSASDSGAEASHAEVESKFKGLVDQDYVSAASTALKRALARLFVAELAESGLYGVAIATLAACVMFLAGWPRQGVAIAWLISIAGFCVGWGVLELVVRRRIRNRFQPTIAARIVQQISASGTARGVRIVAIVSAVVAVSAGLTAAAHLPWVQAAERRNANEAEFRQALDQWFLQPVPDLRLRRYPDATLLRQQADAGAFRAELVYAWALLLGTPAIPKDIAAAQPWLKKLQAQQPDDAFVRAAHAVAVLNAEALPADLRAAYADLQATADQGLVESRYWQSRVLLAQHSPTFNLPAGLRALSQAADAGHANAALALGKRYADGDGVHRDVARARHYLSVALGAGLSEAAQPLTALR